MSPPPHLTIHAHPGHVVAYRTVPCFVRQRTKVSDTFESYPFDPALAKCEYRSEWVRAELPSAVARIRMEAGETTTSSLRVRVEVVSGIRPQDVLADFYCVRVRGPPPFAPSC